MKTLQERLNEIANEVHNEFSDNEYRGLYVANGNEQVLDVLKDSLSSVSGLYIEIGFNYSDSTNLSFAIHTWTPHFEPTLVAIHAGSVIASNNLLYINGLMTAVKNNNEELLKLYKEEFA